MKILNLFNQLVRNKKPSNEVNFELELNRSRKYLTDKISFTSSTTLQDVLTFLKANSDSLGISLNNPATESDIDVFEESKFKLPEDFKTLYAFTNGFETDQDLFRFIPLKEILENGKDNYCINDWSFHFSEYMIYSDMWSVELNLNDIERYRIYNKTDNVVYLTNSLAEFLCVFINKGIYEGLYQWREDKEKE